ncbi:MAG TPA: cytochrome c peroxidase [Nevskia sp.]|nr:cytochrome c peroxidase [Nevskia sp.]
MAAAGAFAACGKTPTAAAAPDRAAAAALPAAAETPFYAVKFPRQASVAEITALGRALFFDPSLSASGRMACSTCHDPKFAFGPSDAAAVKLGGPELKLAGIRAVPSLRYLQNVPAFTEHHYEDDGDDSIDQGVTGGHTWDGRAQSLHDQAPLPLFSPVEMANTDAAAVVAKVKAAPYAGQFRDTFGAEVFRDEALAFKGVLLALEVFQQSAPDFYPYDSKYDAYLRGKAQLTPQEARGLALFNNPAKGNCALCHPSAVRGHAFPSFSDFGYVAVGVPRNRSLPANRDPAYYDLGLCGPLRTDLADRKEFCGLFRAPSLRNVTLRKVFFHNGAFHSLEQVLHFYAERDTNPGKWYPRKADGSIDKFDDLPPQYRPNVNREPPFGGRPGGKPALSEAEIRDLIAFLGTLADGYAPSK